MSRPDTATAAEPRIPRAERTVHRRSAPVPLRVVAQRLAPDDLEDLTARVPRASRPAATPPGAVTAAPAAEAAAPHAPSTVAAPAPAAGPAALVAAPTAGTTNGRPLPVLDRRLRRRPFARLMALVRGRRPAGFAGRHRPDTIPTSGWSMFAPHRRARRRFGTRR